MHTQPAPVEPRPKKKSPLARAIQRAIESKKVRQKSFPDYRRFVQHHYDGLAGELTGLTGVLSGHAVLAGQVFKPRAFDLRGCKRILDAGCGNGRYTRYILRRSDPDAQVAAFDLSSAMLKRASRHLQSPRLHHMAADLTRLPYPTGAFDAIVCGWVLEHLPDPRPGLCELARVLRHGGKMLLMTTEDTMPGSFCSYLWHCRTYNRTDLARICEGCGLKWERPFYFTKLHRLFRLGGIIVELRRQ
jgi:ubiquinone/menaquinone biosynthesis C-methylase UbiE